MGRGDNGTMMVIRSAIDMRWRVRIMVDNGFIAESSKTFDTYEQARDWGIAWCKENNIETETAQ